MVELVELLILLMFAGTPHPSNQVRQAEFDHFDQKRRQESRFPQALLIKN